MRRIFVLPWLLWSARALAGEPPDSCVEVAVNEHPVLAYDCLNRRLAATGPAAVAAPAMDTAAIAGLPPNQQVGQYDFSALSHRMGSNLGKSVYPQRPPSPVPPRLPAPIGGH